MVHSKIYKEVNAEKDKYMRKGARKFKDKIYTNTFVTIIKVLV